MEVESESGDGHTTAFLQGQLVNQRTQAPDQINTRCSVSLSRVQECVLPPGTQGPSPSGSKPVNLTQSPPSFRNQEEGEGQMEADRFTCLPSRPPFVWAWLPSTLPEEAGTHTRRKEVSPPASSTSLVPCTGRCIICLRLFTVSVLGPSLRPRLQCDISW